MLSIYSYGPVESPDKGHFGVASMSFVRRWHFLNGGGGGGGKNILECS